MCGEREVALERRLESSGFGWDSSTGLPAGPLISSELPATPDANEAFARGDFDSAATLFAAAHKAGCENCTSPLSQAWHTTVVLTKQAEAYRRAGQNGPSLRSARQALQNFPRYRPALLAYHDTLLTIGDGKVSLTLTLTNN